MNFVGNIGYVAVAVSGGWLAAKKMVTVGDIQAFLQYVRQFTQPIVQIANISNVLQQTAAAAERIFDFLASEEEKNVSVESPQNGALVEIPKSIKGKVEFRHVRFWLSARATYHQRFQRNGIARSKSSYRGSDRGWQDDIGKTSHAIL